VPEDLGVRPAIVAVEYRHNYTIAPSKRFSVMSCKRVRISGDKGVQHPANVAILREKRACAGAYR